MRFNSLIVSFAISGTLGASITGPGDTVFDSYVKGAETVASISYKPETLTQLQEDPEVPFTPEDYSLIVPQLMQPDILSSLLVDKKVDLNYTGLSVSPEEANEGLIAISQTLKKSASQLIREAVYYKTKLPTQEAAVKRIHASLDRLDKVDNLEQVMLAKAAKAIHSHPNFTKYLQIAIKALPEVFEHDVIGYLTLYFKEADAYSPTVARTLRKVLYDVQVKYTVFPNDYYTKIKKATPISHDKHY
ncbi:hypothetical protein DSO57_1011103 [Entomophthora muscae]|uniref:Uncharacterized protein n=1 Tax=Entomophthora muscae TaxID=34485 RepID=A0ACC2T6F1_9FUNG|nr:hypothetical protein DSO57_1011103 [Entomophthora muscae]